MQNTSNSSYILAISLSSRGFGYAAFREDHWLFDYGHKVFSNDKNSRSITQIDKLITRNQPSMLVLQDVNAKGTHRAPRIKKLHQKVIALAKKHRLKVVKISGKELRTALLGEEVGTKQDMAVFLAKRFPDELASRLPPKRKLWNSEDARMDIFDAIALVIVSQMKKAI